MDKIYIKPVSALTPQQVLAELHLVGSIARRRVLAARLTAAPGYIPTRHEVLNTEEKRYYHKLKMALPSYREEARNARERILRRIALRKSK